MEDYTTMMRWKYFAICNDKIKMKRTTGVTYVSLQVDKQNEK